MLTIGQMARLFDVTTKTLRYYESAGVFCPAIYGRENGYRYYAPSQIDELQRILWLRDMGVPLESIRGLKEQGALSDEHVLRNKLCGHATALEREIEDKRKLLNELLIYLKQPIMENINMNSTQGAAVEPQVKELPAFTLIGMEYRSSDVRDSIPMLWGRYLPREDEIRGRVNHEVSYGLCLPLEDGEFRYIAGVEVEKGTPVPEGMVSVTVAAARYAVLTHTGPVAGLNATFRKACSRDLPESGLERVDGPDFELYDRRFMGPDSAESQVDIYLSIAE
ncbi:uncharacterized protein conserved in bacteria [Hahella chejuensis KCTC 2396]|uniref:Uncharacterized protein conserved in bacteria n=1 Tax=Hahella chejuensis (strain KCTC 2396) TaxID=349521 RepID=Q2SHR5_HAHCH|nr:GyrI-like domain-containing protein [Hahella chejuensis]ABC29809.1 uncharacterized protein conserved in bacteria [Hahella chejuensis KCTC 2396]